MPFLLRTYLIVGIVSAFFATDGFGQCGTLAITGVTATPVSCNGGSNGTITVSTTGGTGPFTYSNGGVSGTPVSTTTFGASNTVSNSSGAPTSVWWSPGTCGSGVFFQYSGSVGCPAGSAVFNGGAANNASCFIRSPQLNMNSINFVTITMDVSHSYDAGRPNDRVRFYVWVNGGYQAVPITINGVAGTSGSAYLNFTQARSCQQVTVTYDLSSIPSGSRSDFFFYIEPSCGYSLCNAFQMVVDNISITEGAAFQSSNTFTNLPAGTYNITVKDANGCTLTYASNPVVVGQPQALTASVGQTNPTTVGGSNGKAWVTASGGTAPYSYVWSAGTPTVGGDTIVDLTAGNYCVTVVDDNGCTTIACGTVTNPTCTLAITSVGKVNATCAGQSNGSFTIVASGANGAVEYSINGGTNWQSSNSFTGLAAGSYTVRVRDAAGCTANAAGNPQVLTAPQVMSLGFATTPVSTVGGNDGAINLTVTGGTTPRGYLWSSGHTTEDISSLTANTYCVTVTDASGCTITNCASITAPNCNLVVTGVVVNSACGNNGSITVTTSGANGAVEYSVNGGASWQSSGTFSGLSGGSYTVQVRDAAGCTANAPSNPYTLVQPTNIGLSFTNTPVSTFGGNDGSINLTVNNATPPVTFQWNNGAATEDITGLGTGQYCVTVTDGNGCTATGCETVTQPGNPCGGFAITNVSTTQPNCPDDQGTITISISGGTNPILYSIDSGATFQNGVSLFTVGGGSYNVLVRDNSGCEAVYASNPVVINTPQGLNPVVTAVGHELFVNDIGVSYQWLYGGNIITGAEDTSYTAIANGSYSVEVTDANGCTYISNVVSITGVGIAEMPSLQWQLWPNPTTNQLSYSISGVSQGHIELWGSDGRLVLSMEITALDGNLDLSNLARGVYTVRLVCTEGQAIKRVVKY